MSNSIWASGGISPNGMQAEELLTLTHLQPYFKVLIYNMTPVLNPIPRKDLFKSSFPNKNLYYVLLPSMCCSDTQSISTDFTLLP
jgi:hypothetical protein